MGSEELLRQRPWGIIAEDHTLQHYQSNWEAWNDWNKDAQHQSAEEVVTSDSLASLPQGMTAFRVLLAKTFAQLGNSESQARKAVRQGLVLLDGEVVQWDTPLPSPGQNLTLRPRPQFGLQTRESAPLRLHRRVHPEHGNEWERISIVSEPYHAGVGIYFVYKPPGVESQPWERTQRDKANLTFEEYLPCVLPCHLSSVARGTDLTGLGQSSGEAPEFFLRYPTIAHRLDLRVCGIVAVATTLPALQHLKSCFEQKTAHKTYRAIVAGDLQAHPLCKAADGPRFVLDHPIAGRESRTEVLVVHVSSSLQYGSITTVNLYPVTGRRHQLREHMAMLGFPIVGDREHWDLATDAWKERQQEGLPSCLNGPLYLQALSLELPLPGGAQIASATIPEAMKFAALRRKSTAGWDSMRAGRITFDEARLYRHDLTQGVLLQSDLSELVPEVARAASTVSSSSGHDSDADVGELNVHILAEDAANAALLEQAQRGDAVALERLLASGGVTDVNWGHPATGFTALHAATDEGHLAAVQVLVSARADPERFNQFGLKAVDLAAPGTEVFRLLDELSVKPDLYQRGALRT